jgi:hypothetical protein
MRGPMMGVMKFIPSVAIGLAVAVMLLGCGREKPTAKAEAAVPWGEAVEGVQARLVADKTSWKSGEVPTLQAEVRNEGERDLIVWQSQRFCELQVDGHWYGQWFIEGKSSWLPHGRQYTGIIVTLGAEWPAKADAKPLSLTPGKHTVRIAVLAEPNGRDTGKPVRAESNAVEIEITPKAGAKE